MVAVNLNDPVAVIEALGLPFFIGFIIGGAVTWARTERVWLSIAMGFAVGAVAFLLALYLGLQFI